MGNHVTDTLEKVLLIINVLKMTPTDVWMYVGNFISWLWLFLACYYEMLISTTHSCVGGMIGMVLILKGSDVLFG